MKIVGIIPVRYNSTRFPGKALALLAGRPMLCHVHEAAAGCDVLDSVYVATDSPEIRAVCDAFSFPVIMTGSYHKNPTSRVKEAAEQVEADLYVMIGGDEPLITSGNIRQTVGTAQRFYETTGSDPSVFREPPYVVNAVTAIEDAAELSDVTNIKVVSSEAGELLYASRSPLPYAKESPGSYKSGIIYRKFVSIGVYTKEALRFFASTPQSPLEQAEECDLLRFIEHRKIVLLTDIGTHTLSVDTPADLEQVKDILKIKENL